MRYYIGCIATLLCLFMSMTMFGQNIVRMNAVKANDYGVAYSLPLTAIEVRAYYTKTTRKVGEFYQYAERYLSMTKPITENSVAYSLDKIEANTYGVVDKSKSYLVEFRAKSTAPFVSLTKEGLICAINADYTSESSPANASNTATKSAEKTSIDPRTYLSEEILRAGSSVKQAELIAKQIYRLRESRTNILTGDADNMPPDGNAYKLVMEQLEEQEKALTAMFVGTEYTETGMQTYHITPTENDIENNILFRFSNKLGAVGSDDLAGAPVYISLKNKTPHEEKPELTPKDQKALEEKFAKGIIYNIPNKATLQITFNGNNYIQTEFDVAQFGTQDVLAPKMFEDGKNPVQVIFHPLLGSIKQILQ